MPIRKVILLVIGTLFVLAVYFLVFNDYFILKWRFKNPSSSLNVEVQNWNPVTAELAVKSIDKGHILTGSILVDPSNTFVLVEYLSPDDCETILGQVIVNKEDPFWDDAFNIGDVVELRSDEVMVSKLQSFDNVNFNHINKQTPRKCEIQ